MLFQVVFVMTNVTLMLLASTESAKTLVTAAREQNVFSQITDPCVSVLRELWVIHK